MRRKLTGALLILALLGFMVILHVPLMKQPMFTPSVLDSCGIITNDYSYGSCVAINPDLLLIAGHCTGIDGAWVEVQGVRYEIVEEWASDTYDVGLIHIDGVLACVELGDMPELLDTVYLVGSPYNPNLVNTVTKGIMSHLDRDEWDWENLIQTDAECAFGSSGGPLFDMTGRIVGICVSGFAPGGGVTLCVPVTDIRLALEEYGVAQGNQQGNNDVDGGGLSE